ncbi:branched-chain amino acid ABC transporter permease [Neorhizobium galegae]|uniref:branched-chain amino acid ABC transporter permease n=1 Tax=Neorhizobium galegae TaxID=399 RepID=UPI0006211353|nr:branched-chain amino acid ABC transporter permease [Neorhizobium galegae]CDZ37048.1 Inner-membrane translocator [Neorhizobium galegae bv. officinalis]KAA9383218.1 branched-chain amino acid ABC transporter permease [Neorhizobium galegae]KAB1112956.1 branched-chain amino acid ABC transporter permease [Neorhizobium galegae]MCM2499833.1 branched-chain amino acid ABC transporter permease [Neorhizobium galegae]MCQ1767803.1 branched-chain amino acid ABC transporter permease [Neorhizobium galegae]
MLSIDILLNAIVTGILLGSVYASLALGLGITFGILHIPNIAHPTLVVAGAFFVYTLTQWGLDPIVAALIGLVPFYLLGVVLYAFYSAVFERKGGANVLQSLTLFFGLSLVIEILLSLGFGSELKSVSVSYIGSSLKLGVLTVPYRLLIPALLAPVTIAAVWFYLSRTNSGTAIRAVAHEERALSIAGLNPASVKRHAFGIATATAVIAGAALIMVGPIEPFAGRYQIGRVFAIVVLAGMGSIPGSLVIAIIIGIAEALVSSYLNPSWSPGVAFAILLLGLALRPQGLFGAAR